MKKDILLTLALVLMTPIAHADVAQDVTSPNGHIHLRFGIQKHWFQRGGKPFYEFDLDGTPLIDHSMLGMEFQTGGALADLEWKNTQHRSVDQNYTMTTGKDHDIRDHFEEYTFALQETKGAHRQVSLIFRVYDDGVAFRYSFPDQPALQNYVIKEEQTQVTLANSPTIFGLRITFGSAYEANYRVGPIDIYKNGETVGLPMVLEYPGGQYVGITEAALTNYSGQYLMNTGRKPNTFETRLAPYPNDPNSKVKGSGALLLGAFLRSAVLLRF